MAGREVALLEAEKEFGTHTSSRNSEVIHAGLYYPPGSLKARSCERGRRALYAYLADKGIPHRRVGKLIVATAEAEVSSLEGYKKTAHANGAGDLEWIDAAEAHRMEPEVRCVRALFSPSTGILDAHGLMRALGRDAQEAGASLARNAPVLGGRVSDSGIELHVGGDSRGTILARTVVNAAGLHAQGPAPSPEGGPAEHGVAGLVNLYGIESPGLTASLALAEDVAALARS